MTPRALQRLIFAGCRALGIDDDTRRDLQAQVTGKASLRDMTGAQLQQVLDELRRRGFDPAQNRGRGRAGFRPAAPRQDLRLIHVLWRRLGEAGVTTPGRPALNAFVRKRFGAGWGFVPADIDALRDAAQINAVIRALRAMADRAGVDLDRGRR
jgi:hypothetical protein